MHHLSSLIVFTFYGVPSAVSSTSRSTKYVRYVTENYQRLHICYMVANMSSVILVLEHFNINSLSVCRWLWLSARQFTFWPLLALTNLSRARDLDS